MSPLVSILIPAFNSQKWISEAIQSALAQTWPDIEVIVVDDGSSDNTLEAARRFESKHCKVLSQENRGASAARNYALSHAQGDFIQWLDADDLLASDKIEQQLKWADPASETGVLLSSGFGTFYHSHENARFSPNSLWQNLPPLEFMLMEFRDNLWMSPSVWLVSRRLTDMAGPWDETLSLNDDGEYFCRVVLASEKIHFVPESRSYKRIGMSGNLSGRTSPHACRSQFDAMSSSIRRVLALEDSERVRKICLALLQRWLIYYYPEETELIDKMNELARFLGGDLKPPQLGWKYSLIQKVFGWKAAKAALRLLPKIRFLAASNLHVLMD